MKNLTVHKTNSDTNEPEEYEVSADGEGVVWLADGEEVIDNPDKLVYHAPSANGNSHIKSSAMHVAVFVIVIVILVFLFA